MFVTLMGRGTMIVVVLFVNSVNMPVHVEVTVFFIVPIVGMLSVLIESEDHARKG